MVSQPEAAAAGTGATAKDEQLETRRVRTDDARLTTEQGVGVDHTDDSLTVGERGPTLLEDFHAREKITHFDHERIPERTVEHLLLVDGELADRVVAGLGLPASVHGAQDNHGRSSPALSQLNTSFDTCATRSVAVLAADGVDGAGAQRVRDLLAQHGVLAEILAPVDGAVRSAEGEDVEVDRAVNTVASVLYDAVIVAGGEDSLTALGEDGYAVHFVAEAYKHAKPVGGIGAGTAEFLGRCGVRRSTSSNGGVIVDDGVVLGQNGDDAEDFVEQFAGQLARHRIWERDTDSVPA